MSFFSNSVFGGNSNSYGRFFKVFSMILSFSFPLFGRAEDADVRSLAKKILEISEENTLNSPAELPATRNAIEPLIRQLDELVPDETVLEQFPRLQGAWKEIWSDDREPEAPGTQVLRESVYQSIFKNGSFYNFAERRSSDEQKTHAILKGHFEIKTTDPRFIQIEFDRLLVKDGGLPKFYGNAFEFASAVEKNIYAATDVTDRARSPRGPIGQKGELRNIFLSNDLRIVEGTNYRDGRSRIYVLVRSTQW